MDGAGQRHFVLQPICNLPACEVEAGRGALEREVQMRPPARRREAQGESGGVQRLGKARGEVFDPWLVDLLAEEVKKAPPTDADREVMIVPAGAMPWRSGNAQAEAEDDDDDEVGGDLEVMLDEQNREDKA